MKRKLKEKIECIQLTPFPVKLFIQVEKNIDAEGLCGYTEHGDIVLKYRKTDNDTLLHEIVHAVDFLEKRIEGRFDTETRAYMTTWLYKQVKQAIK